MRVLQKTEPAQYDKLLVDYRRLSADYDRDYGAFDAETIAAVDKFLAAKSYHASMSMGPGVATETDFVAPDRMRVKLGAMGDQVLIGNTMYVTIQGKTRKQAAPAGGVTASRSREKVLGNLQTLKVAALGNETLAGTATRKYKVENSQPNKTSSTFWVHELVRCRSGSSPPASTAVPARCASRLALPAVRARAVMDAAVCAARACSVDSPSWWATACSRRAPAIDAGCASLTRSKVTISGSATPSGSGADSSSTSLL